jgi:hypothetical protein
MGHYCRICARERPNEQFSGKGHKIHVCKRCQAKPETERRAIEDQDDLFRFPKQSHISEKNVIRLGQMAKSDNPRVASLAEIVLEVARLKPYKTRRLKFLAQKHPELLRKLENTGLIFAHTWDGGLGKSSPNPIRKKRKSLSQRIGREQICPRKRTGRYRFELTWLRPRTFSCRQNRSCRTY